MFEVYLEPCVPGDPGGQAEVGPVVVRDLLSDPDGTESDQNHAVILNPPELLFYR